MEPSKGYTGVMIHVVHIEHLVDQAMDRFYGTDWKDHMESLDTWLLGMLFGNDELALQEDLVDDPEMARQMGYLQDALQNRSMEPEEPIRR